MLIVYDRREKKNAHILKYFEKHGIEYRDGTIKTGDYMNTDIPHLRVERKGGLQELSMNLFAKRKQFWDEARRAHDEGLRMVILCEEPHIRTFAEIAGWKNKYGKVTGRQLQDAIYRLEMAYSIPLLFCDKRSAGRRIIEILTEENNNGEQRL